MKKIVAAIALGLPPFVAVGHHSTAEYSNGELIEISGVLTRVEWRQPHVALFVDVADENGAVTQWRVENFMDPPRLRNAGITADLFPEGDNVVVYGPKSRARDAILASNILTESGNEVVMPARGRVAEQRWGNSKLVGSANTEAAPVFIDAAAENLGFFRVWRTGQNPMEIMRSELTYTGAAVASLDEWDELDNPVMRCEPQGLPEPIFHPGSMAIMKEDDNIILYHHWLRTRRTIYMDPEMSAENQRRSRLGFSQGTWENDRTLVVRTSKIDWTYFFSMKQGDVVELTEVYTLSEDQSRLDLEITITDPVLLAEGQATVNWYYDAQPADSFAPGECNVY